MLVLWAYISRRFVILVLHSLSTYVLDSSLTTSVTLSKLFNLSVHIFLNYIMGLIIVFFSYHCCESQVSWFCKTMLDSNRYSISYYCYQEQKRRHHYWYQESVSSKISAYTQTGKIVQRMISLLLCLTTSSFKNHTLPFYLYSCHFLYVM